MGNDVEAGEIGGMMRRPSVTAAAVFGLGILAAFYFKTNLVLWVVILTLVLAVIMVFYLYNWSDIYKKAGILVCVFALGGTLFHVEEIKLESSDRCVTGAVEIEGVIRQVQINKSKYSFIIENTETKVLVKYYTEYPVNNILTGRIAKVYGNYEYIRQRSNPGCFDYSVYLKSCGIQNIVRAENVSVSDEGGIKYLKITGKIKKLFETELLKNVDEDTAGLVMAIMFGDKTMMDEAIFTEFQENGTAHVLAVSGLHTGILYAFFMMIWKFKRGTVFYAVISVVLLLYMSLADFSPSVVRSVCMIFIHLMACILKSRYDLFSAAGTTFLVLLVHNPFQLFNTGFQMSFLAIASLAVILPFVNKIYEGILLASLSVQVGMGPYTVYLFNHISAGTIVANIPVIFLTGIILPAGLCALIALYFSEEVFGFIAVFLELGCNLMIYINSIFYLSGALSNDVVSPPEWFLVIYYGILFFLFSETGQLLVLRKLWKTIFVCIVIIFSVAVVSNFLVYTPLSTAAITFVDVGQGDCIHIRTEEGKNYLIDGGGSESYDTGRKILKPYLLKNGVKCVDAAFVTHLHEDHYGGIRSLAQENMIKTIVAYEANKYLVDDIKSETGADVEYVYREQSIKLGENVFIEVISPERRTKQEYKSLLSDAENENLSSLILKINYKGLKVLVTGDIDMQGEKELIENYREELDCDVIKVPHHGSKYSSSEEFIETVSPEVAVFQVGKNNYGHPSNEAIKRYSKYGSVVVRNDKDGAVGIILNEGNGFKVVDMIR